MQTTVVYSTSLLFPTFPRIKLMISALRTGFYGHFGFVVAYPADNESKEVTCSFFEVDMVHNRVFHCSTFLPYITINEAQLHYDELKSVWVLAVSGDAYLFPIDVYELPREQNQPWTNIFHINRCDGNDDLEKFLVAFWPHHPSYPLLFAGVDATRMYDVELGWTQWRTEGPLNLSVYQKLGSNYACIPFVCDEGCLLFRCQCIYDEELNDDPVYWKRGTGQWQVDVSAYEHDGTLRRQFALPGVTYPLRDLNMASADLDNWLMLQMFAIAGPYSGPEKRQTCIAALMMQDKPGYLWFMRKNLSKEEIERERRAPKGGLYWFDMHGHILQHDPTLHGEQVSLCVCGQKVIGTHVQDGQRLLWSWSPALHHEHHVSATLSPLVRRATVVAADEHEEEESRLFWCIEEYESGLRIVQYESTTLQERQALWCEGIGIPDSRISPYLKDWEPQGIVAYQDSLLILGINLEKQLQLFQIQ